MTPCPTVARTDAYPGPTDADVEPTDADPEMARTEPGPPGTPSRGLRLGARKAILALILPGLAAAGCSMPQQRFSHSRHRENFAITRDELKGLPFYLSGDVIVTALRTGTADRAAGAGGGRETTAPEDRTILLAAGTLGRVREIGPDWLRVSFGKARTGAYFLANAKDGLDDLYYLATRDETGELRRVEDLEPRTVTYELKTYTVVHGAGAHLLVDGETLQEIIQSRTGSEGVARE